MSAALVLHLTVTESAFVVVTVRSGEPCPDAIVSLWKDAGAQRLDLERLGDEAIGELVEAALGGPVEAGVLRWLCELSEGNALYVRELVVGALDAGTLTKDHGLWHMVSRPTMSRSLAQLVSERMAGLTDAERAPVELLALGEPLGLDELVALSDYESLVAAEALGLVLVGPPASGSPVRLAHPLYGDVVRGDLPMLRRRQLLLRLAETLQRREPRLPDDALRIARWLLDAGATMPTPLLVEAAHAATQADAPELGAQLAELAVDAGAGAERLAHPRPGLHTAQALRRCGARPRRPRRRARDPGAGSGLPRATRVGGPLLRAQAPRRRHRAAGARADLVAG